MLGLPIAIVSMMLFGYQEVNSATGMDVLLQTDKAESNPPSPIASIVQIILTITIYVAFWRYSGQTPGKKMMHIKVVDAKSFERASLLQLIMRFVGYFISSLLLFLGFFVGFLRKDKRSLHDLLSRTAVIYE